MIGRGTSRISYPLIGSKQFFSLIEKKIMILGINKRYFSNSGVNLCLLTCCFFSQNLETIGTMHKTLGKNIFLFDQAIELIWANYLLG